MSFKIYVLKVCVYGSWGHEPWGSKSIINQL